MDPQEEDYCTYDHGYEDYEEEEDQEDYSQPELLQEIPIPLVADEAVEKMEYITLVRVIRVNDIAEKRKESVPCLNNESGAEAALRHWTEFKDSWNASRLSFPTQGNKAGPIRFKYFRDTLRGRAMQLWNQALCTTEGRSVTDFQAVLQEFWKHYIPENAVYKQEAYLNDPNTKKPFKMSVREFNARLTQINWYLSWADGNDGTTLPFTEDQLKYILYNKMLPSWKNNFISSGRKCHKQSRQQIVEYMTDQATLEASSRKRSPSGRSQHFSPGRRQRRHHPYSPRGLYPTSSYYGGSPRQGSFPTQIQPSTSPTSHRQQMQSPITPRRLGFTPSTAERFSPRSRGSFQSSRGRVSGRNTSSIADSSNPNQDRSSYNTPARSSNTRNQDANYQDQYWTGRHSYY
jgi:hypothetical protein